LSVNSAWKPFPPSALSTANENGKILMKWDESEDSGSVVTAYRLYIKTFSSQFTEYTLECPNMLSERQCIVDIKILKASPFSLGQMD